MNFFPIIKREHIKITDIGYYKVFDWDFVIIYGVDLSLVLSIHLTKAVYLF
jgi:hypothetical protein